MILGLHLQPGASADAFKEAVRAKTGVPVERQKLICRAAWQAALKDGATIPASLSLPPGQSELTVNLLGTATAPPEKPAVETMFEEDLSPEARAAMEAAAEAAALADAEGMIPGLQKQPHERDDKRTETYKVSSCVT